MPDVPIELLLREYVDRGSEAAFTAVVERCTGLVYGTALRRVGRDAHLARDVTQLVFIDLARKARTLAARTVIAGWLHHHTCFRAATLVRSERRRRVREEKAAAMQQSAQECDDAWERLAPLLDDALESLPRRDRDAIALRFFADEDLAGMGRSLGVTDHAAQKRVSRALEKLRQFLARRGVATSATGLASAMATQAVQGAPAGVAAAAAQIALLQATATGGGLAALATTLIMGAKTKIAIAACITTLAVTTIVVQQQENRQLRAELANARAARPADLPATAEPTASRSPAPVEPRATAVAPLPKFAASEVEAVMARVIREELWETDHAAFQSLLSRIESRDMPAALAYAWTHTTGMTRRNLRFVLVEHWARREPAYVAAWCRQVPPSADQQQINQMVSNLWAGTDPDAALEFAPSPEGFRQLALRAPERAAIAAQRLPAGDQRQMALTVVSLTRLEQDPRGAVQWLETLDGDDRAVVLHAMLPELTQTDPLAVAGYVARLPATDRATQVTRDFAVVWANQDPVAAAQWSAALPGHLPQRQRAMQGVVEIWARSDPVPAAAWAAQLPPGAARDAAVTTVADVWRQFDPDAARRWVTETALPDEAKLALLKRIAAAP